MWELIRNDPILKSISILIIGVFSFAFAFSIMFGASQGQSGSEHDHGANSTGYSAVTGLGEIITILSKVLIIVLLVAILIAAVKFIQKHVIGNQPINGMDQLKNKPIMTILVAIGGILVLMLVLNLLGPPGNVSEMAHTSSSIHSTGVVFGITGLLSQLLKIVAVVSFVGLIVGLVMYFKERNMGSMAITLFNKELCKTCGNELKANWKCCPSCGTEKHINVTQRIIDEDSGNN